MGRHNFKRRIEFHKFKYLLKKFATGMSEFFISFQFNLATTEVFTDLIKKNLSGSSQDMLFKKL